MTATMSLEAIKAKLLELQMQQQLAETTCSDVQSTATTLSSNTLPGPSSTQHSWDFTKDHQARMKKIEADGNSPDEWRNYIDFLKGISSSSDIRRRPLSEAYSRAFCGILNAREHRNSEVFAKLIMEYVLFKSERFELDSVDTILDMARSNVQSFAVIIIASAEVKMMKGDHEKALSVLTKALAKGRAQPRDLLTRAIKAVEAGQTKLLTDAERRLQVPGIFGQQNNQNTEEFKAPLSFGLAHSHTDPNLDSTMEHSSGTAPSISHGAGNMDPPLITHPPSASKSGMRHYNSTPEVRSFRAPGSHLGSSKIKSNIGMPMRVRNPLQQHAVQMLSAEKEEDTDFIHSIKPLQPLHASTGRFSSLSTVSSGYQSDMTVPMEDSNHSQLQISANRDVFSPNISVGDKKATAEIQKKLLTATEKQAVIPAAKVSAISSMSAVSTPASVPVVTAVSGWQGGVQVMSTPSCKGAQMQPSVVPTPNGEFIETVVVNGESYHILKKVGRGGSATVYMVLDSMKNVRALKVVDLEGAGPEVIDGYRNEISLLQRLQYCDSVIKMYNFEYNEKLNRLYVVLEFGETDLSGFFATRAKQKRGLDPAMIKFYWGEMLRAVNALHQEGIIHSDLKPANFMLVAGNLKLIDFGIANALQQDKTSVLKDSRVGTPSYMSPEAIMAACDDGMDDSMDEKENVETKPRPKYKVGVRSDVWSLGCILYNMVYGRTPFQHIKNNMMKLQAITNPSCEIKFPPIPDAHLMDVLQKCLTRDVKSRPTTKELLEHPYLTTSDKDASHGTSKSSHITVPASGGVSNAVSTPSNKPESRRLKELLQLQMAQGSPGTQALISNLMQKLETEKKTGLP